MNPRFTSIQPSPRRRVLRLVNCGLAGVLLAGCGRAPAGANPPGTVTPPTGSPTIQGSQVLTPTGPELVTLLNNEAVAGSPVRYVEAQVEVAGPPEPGSGRQGVGYRANIEAAEDLFTPVPTAEVFTRLNFDLSRWAAAVRVRREELRPATLREAAPANPEAASAPKDGPEDLVVLRRVARRGQRYAAWGHASLVREVDRWALEEFATTRVEPDLPAEGQPRAVFLSHRNADTVFAEDDAAGLRRWATGWDAFATLVETTSERQRAADLATVARYRQDPAAYLSGRRWLLATATWDGAGGHCRVQAPAESVPVRLQAPGGKLSPYRSSYTMDWRLEGDGSVFLKHPDAPRGARLSHVQVAGDGGRLALVEPAPAGRPRAETMALLEAEERPLPSVGR